MNVMNNRQPEFVIKSLFVIITKQFRYLKVIDVSR